MNPFKDWSRFFFGPISARPLGAFRVVFGVMVLIYLAIMSVEFDHWYTGAGLLQRRGSQGSRGPAALLAPPVHRQPADRPRRAGICHDGGRGIHAGLAHPDHEHIAVPLHALALPPQRGIQRRTGRYALDVLILHDAVPLRSGLLARRPARAKKRGTAAEPLIVPWAVRLLQMQVCLLYFQSAVIKCQGPLWLNGTVVHYILFLKEFREFNLEWLAQSPLLINALTHGAILIEFALAFWLWFKPTRRWAIVCGMALHAGIRPVLNVPGFGEILTATYITFLAPYELQAVLRFLDPRPRLAHLGLRLPVSPLWSSTVRGAALPGMHQLELPFDGTR